MRAGKIPRAKIGCIAKQSANGDGNAFRIRNNSNQRAPARDCYALAEKI